MTKTAKILLGLGVLSGAGVGGYFFLRRRAEELVIVPQPKVHSFDWGNGLIIKVGATFKNPTGVKIKIKYPFVKVHLNDVQIGTSKLRDEVFEIPAYGESSLPEPIELKFTLFELAGLLPTIRDIIMNKEKVKPKLKVEVKTPVSVPLNIYMPVKKVIELSI